MLLDVPYRRMATIEPSALVRIADRLAPLYGPGSPTWALVRERSRYIGAEDRPADIGFRKMRPQGYVQLCVVNDEEPPSPWAVRIPEAVLSRAEQDAFAREQHDLCARLYGEGTLHFLVFAVLAPGGRVPPHRDMPHDPAKKAHSHHLHIPITAPERAELTLKGERIVFERGGVYEIDNMTVHSVAHRGDGFRVNLMLDYCPAANADSFAGKGELQQ